MLKPIHIKEGLRMYRRARHVKKYGLPRYAGSDAEVCKQILEQCYNQKEKYFQVSAGHFCGFYIRDFGWICKSLLDLGYKTKVKHTLEYALRKYSEHGRVRTSISPQGKVFDFPIYAVDSLAYLFYCLSLLDDKPLIQKYTPFLVSELTYFIKTVVDFKTGLVRKDKVFSSMKDHAKRKSSCYDNCMLYVMQQACKKLSIPSGLEKFDYSSLLIEHFWTGEYFKDDLSGKEYVAGDAQVFPFWSGAITDKKILKQVITSVQKEKLDIAMPLRYSNEKVSMNFFDFLASGYEHESIWLHMGPLWVDVVGKVDPTLQKNYLSFYKNHIESFGNFLEVLTKEGEVFKTFFYHTDDSMSWCANYLALVRR